MMAAIIAYKAEIGLKKLEISYTELTSDTCPIFKEAILSSTFSLKLVRSYRE